MRPFVSLNMMIGGAGGGRTVNRIPELLRNYAYFLTLMALAEINLIPIG